MKKKIAVLCLAVAVAGAMLSGCGAQGEELSETTNPKTENNDTQSNDTQNADSVQTTELEGGDDTTASAVTVRVGAMSGPTSMGMVKLMEDAAQNATVNTYEFAPLATEATALSAPLLKGKLDIAAVPSNLAANLYNKTEGGIEVLAVNNLGVLSVVERGEDVTELADLAGRTVYATGQGAVPEYTFRYLLSENGINPDSDISIQWCSDTTEALAYVNANEEAIAVLPQPFVTAACAQVGDLRVAIDLNDEWDKLDSGCNIVTGVIVVRTEFAEEHPAEVATFLQEYEASMEYTAQNPKEAAALIEQYGIVGKAVIAEKALPGCHLNYMDGADMRDALEGFLQVLYDQNPEFVGGSMPGDDFYLTVQP